MYLYCSRLVPAIWPEGFVIFFVAWQCQWCLAAGCLCGTIGDLAWIVAWGVGSEQVVGVGVMLSIAQAALGRVCGSAAVQAVAQDQITASPPAVAHNIDGVKVLPATPGVQCCRCWDRVDERSPESSHFPAEYFTRALRAAACAPTAVAPTLTLSIPPQDMLMQLAKAVASTAAALVLKAKNVAQKTEDAALQTQVIAAATQCALSTSQLVACTKVGSKVNPCLGGAASITWLVAAPRWGCTYARTTRPQTGHEGSGARSVSSLGLGSLPLCPSTEYPLWRSRSWGQLSLHSSYEEPSMLAAQPFSSPPGSGSHNQLPSLPGAAD